MAKIKVHTPLVDLDGDEMTRVIWRMIKDELILPFLDLPLVYFDLHVKNRDKTDDAVTREAAEAIQKYRVGVKCATITPDLARVSEYSLKRAWPSPNATLRSILGGTVFRKPIMVKNIPPSVRSWKKPVVIGRHAYGDIYSAKEYYIDRAGTTELVFRDAEGKSEVMPLVGFPGPGILMCMHNLSSSIRDFAEACITYAISERTELWFCAKDTISKTYHAHFRQIFEESVEGRREEMLRAGVSFRYLLIDDAAAQLMKHEGGIVLGLMNYDGDVWSDLIAAGFGSLGLMTSVLVSPQGVFEYEAAHGTVRRHYQQYLQGSKTSTNPVASIFAWTGALAKRAELDGTPQLSQFAATLEQEVLATIESGTMTGDLARLAGNAQGATTEEFIGRVAERLKAKIAVL